MEKLRFIGILAYPKSVVENTPKLTLYIRNLKNAHLKSIFRQNNIHLVSSTCQHKYKLILCTKNRFSTRVFKISDVQNK